MIETLKHLQRNTMRRTGRQPARPAQTTQTQVQWDDAASEAYTEDDYSLTEDAATTELDTAELQLNPSVLPPRSVWFAFVCLCGLALSLLGSGDVSVRSRKDRISARSHSPLNSEDSTWERKEASTHAEQTGELARAAGGSVSLRRGAGRFRAALE
ncbi:hypothetical protein L1887_61156 [Cichorium endivia]|nr:hypothetical protein L1887_61156 [Cichorium endivia]